MKKYILFYLLIPIIFIGCSDDYLDVNTDPNNPTQATMKPNLILPVAENYTARYIQTNRSANHLGNMFMYNWSESAGYSWYNDEFQYRANAPTFYAQLFDNAYGLSLRNYAQLNNFDPDVYGAYIGIGEIMKAYHFQLLVDFYGDIPYSEALKRSEVVTPKYDKAIDIYESLITKLTEAIDMISAAEDNPSSVLPEEDDIIFNGDLLKWKQFANTIKRRILTRARSAKGNGYVSDQLAVIANEGSGFITEDVGVQPRDSEGSLYSNQENKQNPLWEDFGEDVNGDPVNNGLATCATDYIIQYLQNTNDPRLDYMYEKPGTGHLGVPQGITSSQDVYAPSLVSNIGPGILKSATMPAIIFTVAEDRFNAAELALEGLGGDPEALYNEAVSASFDYLGATGVSAYLAQNIENVNYDFSTNKLEAIITQKWLAVNGITAEQSWFDLTRTGYPANLPISVELDNLKRPYRLSYPASEASTNSENMPKQPDVFSDKIFWAK